MRPRENRILRSNRKAALTHFAFFAREEIKSQEYYDVVTILARLQRLGPLVAVLLSAVLTVEREASLERE